jgi:hypothetical protein
MTIRILENGDYRLQENGCIRDLQQSARVLENLSLRTYQNGKTRQLQDAKALSLQLQNCCGARKLEGGFERLLEYYNYCTDQSACISSIESFTATYIAANHRLELNFKIFCTELGTNPCYVFFKTVVTRQSDGSIELLTVCENGGKIACGSFDTYTSFIAADELAAGNYMATLYLCCDGACKYTWYTAQCAFTV